MRDFLDKTSIGLDIIRNFLEDELSKPNSWNKTYTHFTSITITYRDFFFFLLILFYLFDLSSLQKKKIKNEIRFHNYIFY